MSDELDEHKVVAICPVCKHKIRADKKPIITHYMAVIGQRGNQLDMGPSLPKMACTNCGIEFFIEEARKQLRAKENGEPDIVLAQPKILMGRA